VVAGWASSTRRKTRASTASVLSHPNICAIYGIGEENGKAFIALEYLEGKTLKHTIAGRPMELEYLPGVAIEVAGRFDTLEVWGSLRKLRASESPRAYHLFQSLP